MNQTVFSQELLLKYETWKVLQKIVPHEFLSSTPQPNQEILIQIKFSIPLCLSFKNCKHPYRNHTSKRENCFAIFILVCNFHISLQFSYQFAILTFCGFAIFIWVCNFHISLQFSHHDSITSYIQGFIRIPIKQLTWTHNSTSATVLCGRDKEKLELSKIDYYLLLKSS